MVQLPDPSESSDNDSDDDQGESPPPSKRPRSNDISFDDEESSSSRPSTTIHWDTFVQSGAKLKALTTSILGAMRKKDDVHSIELKTREQLVNDALTKSKPSNFVDENAAKVAHDKTAECMILERVGWKPFKRELKIPSLLLTFLSSVRLETQRNSSS